MEIKVGIQHVTREVMVDSTQSKADVEEAFASAVADGTVLSLTDERGRKVMIPASKIAYLDLGEENTRRVGFGSV